MSSILIETSVEALQKEINSLLTGKGKEYGIYVSLNKTQKSAEENFKKARIDTGKMFYLDCVASQQVKDDVIHIKSTELDKIELAIQTYIQEIPGEKYVVIDSLSTLLIYNNENKVAEFVKEITEFASAKAVHVFAFSPKTEGENLLSKIYNFFDEVKKK